MPVLNKAVPKTNLVINEIYPLSSLLPAYANTLCVLGSLTSKQLKDLATHRLDFIYLLVPHSSTFRVNYDIHQQLMNLTNGYTRNVLSRLCILSLPIEPKDVNYKYLVENILEILNCFQETDPTSKSYLNTLIDECDSYDIKFSDSLKKLIL